MAKGGKGLNSYLPIQSFSPFSFHDFFLRFAWRQGIVWKREGEREKRCVSLSHTQKKKKKSWSPHSKRASWVIQSLGRGGEGPIKALPSNLKGFFPEALLFLKEKRKSRNGFFSPLDSGSNFRGREWYEEWVALNRCKPIFVWEGS